MAPAASVNAARRVHIRDFALLGNVRVLAGGPIVVNRVLRPGMTAAADRRRQIDPRQHGQIKIIGRVVGRRAVTILALHALEPRSGPRAAESGRRSVPHSVAGQRTWDGGRAGLQGLESLPVRCVENGVDGAPMALGASPNSAINRRRAGEPGMVVGPVCRVWKACPCGVLRTVLTVLPWHSAQAPIPP